MIDIHEHIVYGMDDGARTFQDTLDMLLVAQSSGVRKIIATPHSSPDMLFFNYRDYIDKLNTINLYARDNGITVRLYPGTEIFYTPTTLDALEAGRIPSLCMGGSVLVEFMPDDSYDTIFEAFRTLANGGYTPVLAHVERYECMVGKIKRVSELKERLGARIQMNCRTAAKPNGFAFSRFCNKLIGEGIVDFVASDAHNTTSRPINIREAYCALEKRFDADIAEALTGGNQLRALPGLIAPRKSK